MRLLFAFIPSWLVVAYRAIRDHYAPLRGSELVKEMQPFTHMQIERFPHLRLDLDLFVPPERRGRWVFEIEAIGVKNGDMITDLQNQTRAHFENIEKMMKQPGADIILLRKRVDILKATFHIKMIRVLYQLSKWRYPSYWEKRDYWKWLSANALRDYTFVAKILDGVLNFNSNVGDFFFPSVGERRLQEVRRAHPRDYWRTVRCNYWRGEWGDLLSAPLLKVFSVIIDGFERQEDADRPEPKSTMVDL